MEWDPTQFFCTDVDPPAPYALVVLNQPINENAYGVLAGHARAIVCADGGANHFYEMMKGHHREDTDLPTLIIGDLDSIKPHVRSHYEKHGVSIVHDADQYSTDFTKSLKYLRAHEADFLPLSPERKAEPSLSILIMGGLGGRVDQAFSQIHHLYLMMQEEEQEQRQSNTFPSSTSQSQKQDSSTEQKRPSKRKRNNLYLISEESITFILQPGQNKIATPRTNRPRLSQEEITKDKNPEEKENYLLSENIGIIPLSGPARITTHGLQWDVTDWKTEIGGQLSTSNHVRADEVEVCVEGPAVLVTVELAGRFKRFSR
ncbi:thiamine pyrophosphokinase [Aspergillus taichungensis]|uniref:Thiamine pyrophosphokinase n=1 Tax=Aspergillus taichungensis TaxID=482145 RepID=A0A2J5HQ18_9EURO|nr:thiamine pyrophosphokinase [Aspergillus taichungensis]